MRLVLALLAIVSLGVLGCGGGTEPDKSSTADSGAPASTDAPKSDSTDGPKADPGTDSAAGQYALVQATLNTKCGTCHTGPGGKEGLDISSYATLMKGTKYGPIIIAGKPDESKILKMITGAGGKVMPPKGKGVPVTAEEVKLISDWITAGAAEK